MNKLKSILFLFLLLPLCVKPLVLDSLQKEELIAQGVFKLNALKKANQQKILEGKTNELNFIVNLTPDNTTDYITDYNLAWKPNFIYSPTLEQQLNNRLQQVYNDKNKECYLILISAFDVEIKAPVPSGLTTQDVFNKGKFFNEQSDIETHKSFHNDVVTQIANNSSISSNNRNCYVLSVGAYCGTFYRDKIGCYYYWFTKKVSKQTNDTIQHFEETYDYLKTFLENSNDFKHPTSRDNLAEQVVNAFESAAKNAELKAQILTTHTSPVLENILSNFIKTEDYFTLSLEERIHILKVFLTSLTFNSSETYISNVLRTIPKQNVNDLLTALLNPQNNINGTCLLYRLFTGIQGNNYTMFIKDICHLVGRSSLNDHNLPVSNTDYSAIQTSAFSPNDNWYRTFEWTDCWNRINPSDPNDPNNVSLNNCNWTEWEKRFTNITVSSDGTINVEGSYDSGETAITAPGDPPFNPVKPFTQTYHPYDLVVFVNKSGITSINEGSTDGVVVVPALFLKFAYDKAFNQGLYDAALIEISILGILGADEVMLASKVLGRIPKIKSLIKWIWKEEVASAASLRATRINWLNNLKTQFNVNDLFSPQGLNPNSISSTLKNDIISGFSNALPATTKESFFNTLVKSGSTTPIKKTLSQGDELYKIVPKGNGYSKSSFYMSKQEYNGLKNSTDIEQKLGLPLNNHAVEYDVYKATANQNVDVFESTVANTTQGAYNTTGGAKQTFLLDDSKWTISKESNSLVPPKQ